MVQITHIKQNNVEVCSNNLKVLFSYSTPVVVVIGNNYFVTKQFHSRTTSGHINKYIDGIDSNKISYVEQLVIEKECKKL